MKFIKIQNNFFQVHVIWNTLISSNPSDFQNFQQKKTFHKVKECRTSFRSIAKSFIQIGLDGVQKVGCVDVMFIQFTPAIQQSVTLIWEWHWKPVEISQQRGRGGGVQDKQAAALLGQAVDAACQVFGHDAAFHRVDANLL